MTTLVSMTFPEDTVEPVMTLLAEAILCEQFKDFLLLFYMPEIRKEVAKLDMPLSVKLSLL